MRGADPLNTTLFTTRRPDDFVPDNHPPPRPVRKMVNSALKNIE